MCMQCMASAMGAVGVASGARAFVASRHFSWLTPRRLRILTILLLTAALLASATLVAGTGPGRDGGNSPPGRGWQGTGGAGQ
jgi:hypothetical protein